MVPYGARHVGQGWQTMSGVATIPLGGQRGAGRVAIVDAAVAEAVAGQYCVSANGYAVRHVPNSANRTEYLHRVVLNAYNVRIPRGMCVDHANGNRLDNRLENLVVTDYSRNNHNHPGRRIRKNLYKGVSYNTRPGRLKPWVAECSRLGVRIKSYHETELEAARAYNAAAVELYGPGAWQNVIPAS